MKYFAALALHTVAISAVVLEPRAAVERGATTLVFKEVGGVRGNECITFRNNGESVDAACVNTAADRQMTPSTLNGASVLLLQREFSNGFRPDLVNKQVCLAFNGTAIRAEDCASTTVKFVSQKGDALVASNGACLSGHNAAAETQVDKTGKTCASFTTTVVKATKP